MYLYDTVARANRLVTDTAGDRFYAKNMADGHALSDKYFSIHDNNGVLNADFPGVQPGRCSVGGGSGAGRRIDRSQRWIDWPHKYESSLPVGQEREVRNGLAYMVHNRGCVRIHSDESQPVYKAGVTTTKSGS
jgi:hypothetical protein